jgi:dynein heavy chain, axonemal
LEGKRNKFPRFYFTSDPVLLKILSQGSDPEQIQDDFEKLFDSISRVTFDIKDKKKILKIHGENQTVDLPQPVMAVGNIEDWLCALEAEMQRGVRKECKIACADCGNILQGLSVKDFSDK